MNFYDFALKNFKTATMHYSSSSGDNDELVISCQQYFEKAFKELVKLKTGEVIKTHKIVFLVNKLGITEFTMHEDLFRRIQDYYFDKRYPSEIYVETGDREANMVYEFVLKMKPGIEFHLKEISKEVKRYNLDNSSSVFSDL